ncbi:uncharacterized protein LOC111099121 isoform X1 [Crassostrea virginica]
MEKLYYRAILLLTGISLVHCLCSDNHCHHVCGEKFRCVSHAHDSTHGCDCLPKDYCDAEFSCRPSDVTCSHNELIRCGRNNKCECYCSQDSQCQNCPDGTLGFCVKEKCICESRSYCPGGNKFYCLKNFQCAHNESRRCNTSERCECYCDKDTNCKNCPQKGFCVDGGCVCESQNYCPKGNHFYCLFMTCANGYTGKCNSTNHCYCAYVPDTCSEQDVSKCFHLSCSTGEKKYCEGRTCTCKPIDYCKQNDADCRHKTCDASKAEVNVCLNSTCSCLVIPDFCGGDDTSTCQHLHCNPYQVKKCENGMCKCQVNPSCNSNAGLRNNTCTPENTYLEVKGANGKVYYANCTDENHYPLCVDGRCNCVYWKTPKPLLTSPGITSSGGLVTDSTSSAFTLPDTTTTTAAPTNVTTTAAPTNETTSAVSTNVTTQQSLATTTAAAACSSRKDCNQQNTFAVFLTFNMPCPVDHIDCVDNSCICSADKVTTTPLPTTTTTTIAPISCHQCGNPDANSPCDLRTVYMGQPTQCTTGSYCMTDVVQGADDSVAIYKRCVDEVTCLNEWMAQTSDQDRCLRYAEGAVPGQYTCHYCCTTDGCNSKIVPEAKYFYSSSASIN